MTTDNYLIELGLVSTSGQASRHFASVVPSLSHVGPVASDFVETTWQELNTPSELSNNLRGGVFEILIGVVLVKFGIKPFYRQAEVTFVNNARFDFLLWEGGWNPISLSIKTSLRERYKQAELEAGALKNVHRKSENYLVTVSESEVLTRRRKLEDSSQFTNLDLLVLANKAEFDELIKYLQSKTFAEVEKVSPMANNHVISD